MNNNKKELADFLKPPTSVKDKADEIFSERFVRMHGQDYYLRVFKDGSGEYTRYDLDSGKWVFLIFPAA
jgi:hypothetical protein